MAFRSKENELMWEQYMDASYKDVPLVKAPRQPVRIDRTHPKLDPLLTAPDVYLGGDEEDNEFADYDMEIGHDEPDGDEAAVMVVGPPMGGMETSDVDVGFDAGVDNAIPDAPDERVNVEIYSELKRLAEYSKSILDHSKCTEFEPWMQAKIIKASNYICDVYYYLDAEVDFKGVKQDYGDYGSHEDY